MKLRELDLKIVVDVRSFTVAVLIEPDEIILTDYPAAEKQQSVLATSEPYKRPAVKSYRDPTKVSKVGVSGERSPVMVAPEFHTRT